MSVKKQAAKSVFWSAVERFSVQGIQFLLSIIIARILLPSDYGLIAMLSIFMAIAQTFIDSGFGYALIQKKNRQEIDFSTVFYFNIVVSGLLYLLLYGAAPFIAAFYAEPALNLITKIVGISLIINSFGIVQQARLTIALDFRRLAYASLISVMVSGAVGVYMAYHEFGVWALVWQSLLNNLFRVTLTWAYSHWLPAWAFSRQSFRSLFSFGSKLLASSLLHTLYVNLYTLIIGKRFASAELGYYNRAFTLAQFPSTNFTNVIVRAIYPIQCRIQDDDEQLRSIFLKYMKMACYLIFPVMIGLAALAKPIVSIVLTDKWLPCVPLMQLMCIAYMWDPVMKINHNILSVKGRTDYFLYAEIYKKIVAFAILFATIPFGVQVMCAGLILYSFADIFIITRYSYKVTQITLFTQFRTLLPVILLSVITGISMYLPVLFLAQPAAQLAAGALLGGVIYIGLSALFKMESYEQLLSMVLKRTK